MLRLYGEPNFVFSCEFTSVFDFFRNKSLILFLSVLLGCVHACVCVWARLGGGLSSLPLHTVH